MTLLTGLHKSRFGAALTFLIISATLSGCSVPIVAVKDMQTLKPSTFSFIEDGVTTREEVRMKLDSEPIARFESERIEIYKVDINPPPHGTGRLVLVFGPDGILRRHSLVGAE